MAHLEIKVEVKNKFSSFHKNVDDSVLERLLKKEDIQDLKCKKVAAQKMDQVQKPASNEIVRRRQRRESNFSIIKIAFLQFRKCLDYFTK